MRIPARAVKRGRGPAHAQIEAWLAAQIGAGRLERGSRLPPERTLAGRLGVSRMTLRHALESLERRGLVERRVGRDGGTFVAEPKLELTGTSALSDQLRGLGLRAGARVLVAEERDATGDEAVLGRRVFAVERVRLADGDPVALERTTFPAEVYPGLLDGPLEGSLYDLIRSRYAEVPVRAVERLEPGLASATDAGALGIEPGAPVMLVERVAYGADGRPLERSRDVFRGDRTRVVWESEILGSR
jgi:GntR family transcriptional regulator